MEKIKLILADEDENLINEMKNVFTNDMFEVIKTTSSGTVLINLIKTENPDGVIMDVVLQNCDGFKVLESVDCNKTKIVVQSSLSMDGFINKAISSGAKYYCIKPFDVQTLKERIEDLISPQASQSGVFFNAKTNNQIEE